MAMARTAGFQSVGAQLVKYWSSMPTYSFPRHSDCWQSALNNGGISALLLQARLINQAAATGPNKYGRRLSEPLGRREKTLQKELVVYVGTMSDTVRRVKALSFTTCCLSILGGPFITFFTSPGLPVIMKGAVASTMVLFSASTTAGLHWFASPYVHKLTWTTGEKEMHLEVLSWMATSLKRTVRLSDVKHPETQRPLVTFFANGHYYFIDKDNFPNEELLSKLLPRKDI